MEVVEDQERAGLFVGNMKARQSTTIIFLICCFFCTLFKYIFFFSKNLFYLKYSHGDDCFYKAGGANCANHDNR